MRRFSVLLAPADVAPERSAGPSVEGVVRNGQRSSARVTLDWIRAPSTRKDWPDPARARVLTDWWRGSAHCAKHSNLQVLGYPCCGGVTDCADPSEGRVHLCSIGDTLLETGIDPGWSSARHLFLSDEKTSARDFSTLPVGVD